MNGNGFGLQYFADELIGNKKYDHTKSGIHEMLYDAGAFFYQYTTALLQFVRSLGRVPDAPAIHDVNNIVVVAPELLILYLVGAADGGDE